MKLDTTSVLAVPSKFVPRPASSKVASGCSMYPSINFSCFHRPNRNRMAADSGGRPRIAETSLICTSCSRSISEGSNTLKSTSYGFRFCLIRSLSSENPVSMSPKSIPQKIDQCQQTRNVKDTTQIAATYLHLGSPHRCPGCRGIHRGSTGRSENRRRNPCCPWWWRESRYPFSSGWKKSRHCLTQ